MTGAGQASFARRNRPARSEDPYVGADDAWRPQVPRCASRRRGCPEWPEAMIMDAAPWIAWLERADTSYLLLATLAAIVASAGVLYQLGLIGWVLRRIGVVIKGAIRAGFL